MKCEICGKPIKENTAGNLRYCQGHWILESSLNPNCSEAVMRIKTTGMDKKNKDKLFTELKKVVDKYDKEMADTSLGERKIFEIECFEISGDMPFNDHATLEAIVSKYGVDWENEED